MTTTKPPYPAQAVANTIIDIAGGFDSAQISPMKMQKLVFFAHGWYLAYHDSPLICDPVKAWQYGPVIEPLYHALKVYGADCIKNYIYELEYDMKSQSLKKHHLTVESPEVKNFLKDVYSVYGQYTAIQLSNLSHENGSPWHTINKKRNENTSTQSIEIPNDLIKAFYSEKLKEIE